MHNLKFLFPDGTREALLAHLEDNLKTLNFIKGKIKETGKIIAGFDLQKIQTAITAIEKRISENQ